MELEKDGGVCTVENFSLCVCVCIVVCARVHLKAFYISPRGFYAQNSDYYDFHSGLTAVGASSQVAPQFKRFTKAGQTSDVMFVDGDEDGCFDYFIIWLNGDFWLEETLLKTGGGTVLPTDWTAHTQVADVEWSVATDTFMILLQDTTSDDSVATIKHTVAMSPDVCYWTRLLPNPAIADVKHGGQAQKPFVVFPNPARSEVTVRISRSVMIDNISLCNLNGTNARDVRWIPSGEGDILIPIADEIPSGLFLLSVRAGNQYYVELVTVIK